MTRRRVCFVTFELAPFTGGGIGTWLANTLETYEGRGADFEVLFCGATMPDRDLFRRIYPRVVLHAISLESPDEEILHGRSLRRGDMISVAQWRSYLLMCALEKLERETGRFDVIEFVDWCGAAYFSLNAKRLGRSFQQTVLSVRLHATESVLRDHETRSWSGENLVIADLERQALLDADLKIAHLSTVADAFQKHFAFPDSWRENFRIESPPVAVVCRADRTSRPTFTTPIVFTSKFQSIKRPEIFARAASRLLSRNRFYQGAVRFLAFDVDPGVRYLSELAFPQSLRDRVVFGGPSDRSLREETIRDSVAVFPGAFETYCFAAYEASLAGAIVVLNARNPAFGEGTPWIDGVNCLKFDGTSLRLHETLERIFSEPSATASIRPVEAVATEKPYWETVVPGAPVTATALTASVVVPHRFEGGLLHATVDSVLSDDEDVELAVVSHGNGEPGSDLVLDALEDLRREAPGRIKVIRRDGNLGVGGLLPEGIEETSGDIVAIIPAGFELLRGFLKTAIAALAAQPSHDAVLPMVRVVSEHDVFRTAEHWLPMGANIHYGLFVNRMTSGCVVARRSLLEAFPPNEVLTAEWLWDVMLRAAFSGRRFLVTDEPGVQAIGRVHFDHYAHSEQQRRDTFETVRRNLAVEGIDARASLAFLGDGELLSATGPIAASLIEASKVEAGDLRRQLDEVHHQSGDLESWRQRALHAEDQLRVLSDATSVRLALGAARAMEKARPWLRRPLRAALRRRR